MYGIFRERTLLHELYLIVPLIVHALRSHDHRTLERVEKGAPEVCVVTGTKTLNTKKIPHRKPRGEGNSRANRSWENAFINF